MKFKKLIFLVPVGLFVLSSFSFAAQNAQVIVKASNKTTSTITPSALQFGGTVSPTPVAVAANSSQSYANTSVGNAVSFHVDYANTSGKKCHFDASSFNRLLKYCSVHDF